MEAPEDLVVVLAPAEDGDTGQQILRQIEAAHAVGAAIRLDAGQAFLGRHL